MNLEIVHSDSCFVQLLCKLSVKSVSNCGKSTEMGFGATADVVGGERGCGLSGFGAVVCFEWFSVCYGSYKFWVAG